VSWIRRRGWLAWGAVILVVSVVPVEWVFGLAPRESWSPLAALGHFTEFGLFAALVALAWAEAHGGRRPGRATAAGATTDPATAGLTMGALAAVSYGAAIELIQAPIPYRSADPLDFLTDVVGAAVALALVWYVRRRWARRVGPTAADDAASGGGR